ncbi:MAG: hypothetical protein COB20_03785 [SAR86 cluster bacterium]|uniref:DUF1722 domain-containing protein n=1 Tax=SAR86 cluster bacterium TaxID=2030880 RepID=A0A2A4XD12_9GAMM|nr:MAG: hypothetical protein COB20_03785 [SAR86 cluster bacterium]
MIAEEISEEIEGQQSKIPVGISSCLLGEKVRYDGGHKNNSYIAKTLGQYFDFQAFCPELDIGLGIPRKPIRLSRKGSDVIRCTPLGNPELDFTEALAKSADEKKQWHSSLCGYILKKDSPSCGMERVKIWDDAVPIREGVGIYAGKMMENFPYLPVEEEGRLGDAVPRENFIQRVFIMHRWKQLKEQGMTLNDLLKFHARHELIIMSRDQNGYCGLEQMLAAAHKDNVREVAEEYLLSLMRALKIPATRGNHVNVLQHIQGYLKKPLDADDKLELTETVEKYRRGQLPLIVPITLLNHFFRKQPDEYIANSWYMNPCPEEMSLQNPI